MKKYTKKRWLMLVLSIFVGTQPALLNSGIAEESSFLGGYFFGTGVGACALAGIYTILPALQKYVSEAVKQSNASHNSRHGMNSGIYLPGYIGAIPQEVADLIMQLRNPQDYLNMRVKLTKGLIFFGPPGSGKTQLARCLAAEVNCPFLAANATDFKKPHIGEGSQMVTELFKKARDAARQHHSRTAILFIDEFDAVDTRVGGEYDAGRSEVINTLLNEMLVSSYFTVNVVEPESDV